MKHLIPQALQTAMRKYLPSCIVSYEFQADQYVIENPVNGLSHRVSHEALKGAPSLNEMASFIAYDMGKRFEYEVSKRGDVGFYGVYPGSSSINTLPEKENTKMLPEATCPRCLAPEEQEITTVEQTFSVKADVGNEADIRRFIVNAFSRLDAINFAVEILQDEAEAGAEVDVRGVSAVEMPNTEILL